MPKLGQFGAFLKCHKITKNWRGRGSPKNLKFQENHPVRYNVFAYPKCTKPNDLKLVFNTHLDVVPPWFGAEIIDPSKPETFKGYWNEETLAKYNLTTPILAGRGSNDTKSLSASMLKAVNDDPRLVRYRDQIGFLFVVSEETTHQGMKLASQLKCCNPEFLIVGEPTEKRMIRFQKGILKCKIKVNGIAAHSGYPELGVSANSRLVEILSAVESFGDWPTDEKIGETNVNIGFITGGQAANALAEYAESYRKIRNKLKNLKEK